MKSCHQERNGTGVQRHVCGELDYVKLLHFFMIFFLKDLFLFQVLNQKKIIFYQFLYNDT